MGIDNDADWQSFWSGRIISDGIRGQDSEVITDFTTEKLLRITAQSEDAKPHWWFGCRVYELEGNTNIQPHFSVGSWVIPLNLTKLIELKKYSNKSKLKIVVPSWHKSLELNIERYTGN